MIDLGDCTLCGHPRCDHEDFERCTVEGCDCVRPAVVLRGSEVRAAEAGMPEEKFADWLRAVHEIAEAAVTATVKLEAR